MYQIIFSEDEKHDMGVLTLLTDKYMQIMMQVDREGKLRIWREHLGSKRGTEKRKKQLLFDDLKD